LTGPYVPADPRLYEYDNYDTPDEPDPHAKTPRWPWVVGVTVIIAAISLVVSVALLFARTETHDLATQDTTSTTVSQPPVQDEITRTSTPTTTVPPPPPPPASEEPPPPPPSSEEPPPPPVEAPAPEPSTTTTEPTTTTQAKPMQVTYSVTGTKAPFDQITITYVDASGQRRTQRNAYIPWSLTLTPISQSEVGSVEASSMLRLSKLNCSITSSDGRVLSANSNDAPATSCG
jgi:type IV secretory pathway VirB10-like protein